MAQGLHLRDVTQYYLDGDQRTTALNHVSLSVLPGEFVAVIGPSGSGKSTFLSVAGALLQPTEGEIEINGKSYSKATDRELSQIRLKEIGFIMQTSNLVPYLNALQQLLVVKKMSGRITSADKVFASKLLEELGLGDKLSRYPEELSGGERQRVAIARAFMNDPQVILADEPTASLDTARSHEVTSLIAQEVKARKKAAVMVTHDERMLTYVDKVYRMEDGVLSQVAEPAVG
ncbi:ABC transporter ATP-binding protein [Gorillibacterium sp. sgz500922]|uniref:ABC transporter ATP-binding protein n=1 Tax=Gorillibacterium sp. sgz500922 TaxID=3446694 RepID=UPI003F667869